MTDLETMQRFGMLLTTPKPESLFVFDGWDCFLYLREIEATRGFIQDKEAINIKGEEL